MIAHGDDTGAAGRATVLVVDWFEELNAQVPASQTGSSPPSPWARDAEHAARPFFAAAKIAAARQLTR